MKLSENRVPFKTTWLEELRPTEPVHVHYYDTMCSALALRLTPAGTKLFKAFNRSGAPQFISIAEAGQISIADARQQALAILQSIRTSGMTPADQEAAAEEDRQKENRLNITLGAALEAYVTARRKPNRKLTIKAATAANMKRKVEKYLKPLLAQPLRTLTYPVLHEWHEAIIEDGAPTVADRVMRNVGSLIRFVEEKEEDRLFSHNPASNVLRLDGRKLSYRETFLPAGNFPDFFHAVHSMPADERDFLLVSLFTGLRAESVRTLKWKPIDFKLRLVTLTTAKGEEDDSIALPLSDFVLGVLSRRMKRRGDSPFVFPHNKNPTTHLKYHDSIMDHLWQAGGGLIERERYQVQDRDGKPRFNEHGEPMMDRKIILSGESSVCNQHGEPIIHHDFRRTFTSVAAAAAGVDTFAAMRLSLHKNGAGASPTHSRYVQLLLLRPALELITEAILTLGGHDAEFGGREASNVIRFPDRTTRRVRQQDNGSPLNVA